MLKKYEFLKKNLIVIKAHLNTLLDIMITTTLDSYIKLPQITEYAKYFHRNKAISFKVSD